MIRAIDVAIARHRLTSRRTEGPMQKMPNSDASKANAPTDRRTRHRLRELCDEVIASYRAAKGHQIFSDRDREEGYALMNDLVPLPVRRRA